MKEIDRAWNGAATFAVGLGDGEAGRRDRGAAVFEIENLSSKPAGIIRARYTGWAPDYFRGGVEIVAKGRLASDGTLEVMPDGIMTKGPSNEAGAYRVDACHPR